MKRTTSILYVLLLQILVISPAAIGQSLVFHSKVAGFDLGSQLTFDLYKPFASLYFNIKRYQKPVVLTQGNEAEIYTRLGRQLLLPKYLLFQITGYPLSAISSFYETDRYVSYQKFAFFDDINILRSIGAGFEEPYAFSLFLGNVLLLAYSDGAETKLRQSGSALAGFLISHGRHQIYNNIYLHDSWYQFELMLIGNLKEPNQRRISWNFRIGAKLHQNDFIRDTITMAIERNHTDWQFKGWSLAKNSVLKYAAHFPSPTPTNRMPSTSQLFTFGKKFPVTILQKRIFLILGLGVQWEWIRLYDHSLNRFDENASSQLTFLIQPNIEF
ncbi:MAG TPA: hypothetical protein VGD14_14225 [bacterium]